MTRISAQFFSDAELRCKGRPKCGCMGRVILNPIFDNELYKLRVAFGQPMIVNSCLRCKAYNAPLEGASNNSFHVYDQPHYPTQGGAAIDISTIPIKMDDQKRLVQLAWQRGWSIGVAKNFLHFDVRKQLKLLPQAMFTYATTPTERYTKFQSAIKVKT